MIKPVRRARALKAQKSRSVVKTIAAPTGGWNARDAIADMPETDAVAMVNFFPQATDVTLRYGTSLQVAISGSGNTGNALLLGGTSGYITTPDSVPLSITGAIDIRAYVALDSYTTTTPQYLVSKGTPIAPSATNYSYQFYVQSGSLHFGYGSGAALLGFGSTANLTTTAGSAVWLRVTLSGGVGTFYTSPDGVTYTQLGATAAFAAVINDTATALEIGRGSNGSITYYASGKIYRAQIYSGVGGTLAGSFSGNDANIGATTVTSSQTGEIYTVTGNASIIYDATIVSGGTAASNQVETLMAYSGGVTNKLFAINGGQIWDVTTLNAPTLFNAVSLGGSRWGYVNFATSGGNFLVMANQQGLDSPYTYNGTVWTQPAITGVTTSTLINVNAFKNRLWFIQQNTLKAWYLPTASIAGALNSLDLSAFMTRGGKLIAMATWTIDAGYGVDDLAVFLSDKGEVAVYRGTDPASAATWMLVGVYWIGSPIGLRPFVKFAGDCLIITQDGVVPLSGALQSSRTNPRVAISDKIQSAISDVVSAYGDNFGWQVIPFPKQNMVIVNVPISEGVMQEQYVMNTITGAWCRFTGWNANCWEIFNDDLYFGGVDRTVMKAWTGTSDNSVAIEGAALQAFNYFGSSGQQKRWPMMRPIFLATGAIPLSCRMNIDFDQTIVNDDFSNTATVNGAVWDSAVWDADRWQNDFVQSTGWRGAAGVGFCAAPEIGIQTATIHARWVSTDIVVEAGATL